MLSETKSGLQEEMWLWLLLVVETGSMEARVAVELGGETTNAGGSPNMGGARKMRHPLLCCEKVVMEAVSRSTARSGGRGDPSWPPLHCKGCGWMENSPASEGGGDCLKDVDIRKRGCICSILVFQELVRLSHCCFNVF